jgi:hypothetical protein
MSVRRHLPLATIPAEKRPMDWIGAKGGLSGLTVTDLVL